MACLIIIITKMLSILKNKLTKCKITHTDYEVNLTDAMTNLLEIKDPKRYIKEHIPIQSIAIRKEEQWVTLDDLLGIMSMCNKPNVTKMMAEMYQKAMNVKCPNSPANFIELEAKALKIGGIFILSFMEKRGNYNDIWCLFSQLHTLLGYTNTIRHVLKDHVSKNDHMEYAKLMKYLKIEEFNGTAPFSPGSPLIGEIGDNSANPYRTQADYHPYLHPAVPFINLSGVLTLISKSKLPNAQEYQKWVWQIVVPQIYLKGSFILKEHKLNYKIRPSPDEISEFKDKSGIYMIKGSYMTKVIIVKRSAKLLYWL